MGDEEKDFKVKDRRFFDEEGNPKGEEAPEEAAPVEEEPAPARSEEPPPQAEEPSPGAAGPLPPPDFSGLIVSLSHAAMMHLGQIPDMRTGEAMQPDLALARHTIDTIGMLQEKTQGNLSEEEDNLITHALSDLRLLFVRVAQGSDGS
jgi:hypothetical protein